MQASEACWPAPSRVCRAQSQVRASAPGVRKRLPRPSRAQPPSVQPQSGTACSTRTLGAPLTVPAGSAARSASQDVRPGLSCPVTVRRDGVGGGALSRRAILLKGVAQGACHTREPLQTPHVGPLQAAWTVRCCHSAKTYSPVPACLAACPPVEEMCMTWLYRSISISFSTRTVPACDTCSSRGGGGGAAAEQKCGRYMQPRQRASSSSSTPLPNPARALLPSRTLPTLLRARSTSVQRALS